MPSRKRKKVSFTLDLLAVAVVAAAVIVGLIYAAPSAYNALRFEVTRWHVALAVAIFVIWRAIRWVLRRQYRDEDWWR